MPSRGTDRPRRAVPSSARYSMRCRSPRGARSCMPRSQRWLVVASMRSRAPSRSRMATPPGLTYSAHGLARGNRAASSSSTRRPCAANKLAQALRALLGDAFEAIGPVRFAPELDGEPCAADLDALELNVGQPRGQRRMDRQALARGVRAQAQHGLDQLKDAAGGPRLRDVGAEILDRERALLAR